MMGARGWVMGAGPPRTCLVALAEAPSFSRSCAASPPGSTNPQVPTFPHLALAIINTCNLRRRQADQQQGAGQEAGASAAIPEPGRPQGRHHAQRRRTAAAGVGNPQQRCPALPAACSLLHGPAPPAPQASSDAARQCDVPHASSACPLPRSVSSPTTCLCCAPAAGVHSGHADGGAHSRPHHLHRHHGWGPWTCLRPSQEQGCVPGAGCAEARFHVAGCCPPVPQPPTAPKPSAHGGPLSAQARA